MKIYINNKNEIKDIYTSTDTSLTEIMINRKEVFGDKSDFLILNYKYIQHENGCIEIVPASNLSELLEEDYRLKVDDSVKKISILESENKELREELKQIQVSLTSLVLAIENK